MTTDTLTPLMEALALEELLPEEREALLLDMHGLLFEHSLVKLVSCMDDGTCEEFTALVEGSAEDEAIEAFIREKVPHADRLVEEAAAELTNDILASTGTNNA